MLQGNETHFATVDVLDSGFSEEKVHEVTLRHWADEIRRWNKERQLFIRRQLSARGKATRNLMLWH